MLCSMNTSLCETVGESVAGCCIDFKNVDKIQNAITEIYENYDQFSANSTLFYNQIDIKKELRMIIDKWVSK